MSEDIPVDELEAEIAAEPTSEPVRRLVGELRRQSVHVSEDIDGEVGALYHRGGLPRGDLTGWRCVDDLYTVAGAQWTLVTGIPGMGKSEWLDALMVNLAERGWNFGLFSPENYPVSSHAVKLLEKHLRAPFNVGPNDRMTDAQWRSGMAWIHEHFCWLKPESEAPIEIICHALGWARKRGKFGIVMDPWNALNHYDPQWRDKRMSETEFVSDTLTRVTRILRRPGNENVHLWIVAHPAKLYRGDDGKYPVPTGYDISGSAHWFNKADNIICVHRDKSDGNQNVDIAVQKVRFKHTGRVGLATLKYDRTTGRYFEFDGPPIYDPLTGKPEIYADPERR